MLRDRFIPTPVGNTPNTASAMPVPPVHPHACGEHTRQKWPPVANSGSSPRLWGTLVPVRTEKQRERFIPTPVGNTLYETKIEEKDPVHPHACGEHIFLTRLMT